MTASDVLAVVAATVVTILVAVLAMLLVQIGRTLRALRATVVVMQDEAISLLDDARGAMNEATLEIDRVERLLTSAEKIGDAKRTLATPMVKAMAFGTGVSRATRRLRVGDQPPPRSRRRSAS